jgi:transposase-like protein
MRVNPHAITVPLDPYFERASLRKIVDHLKQFEGVSVSHPAVLYWIEKYVALMKQYVHAMKRELSKVYHADETKMNIRGQWVWLWHLMDGDTRFLLASHVSYGRRVADAREAFQEAKAIAKTDPRALLTDGLESYRPAAEKEFPDAIHIAGVGIQGRINNNRIERYHSTFKERSKVIRALKKTDSPFVDGQRIYYGYLGPHSALQGKTPAEAAGIDLELEGNKWEAIIKKASHISQHELSNLGKGSSKNAQNTKSENWLRAFGFDVRRLVLATKSVTPIIRDFREFQEQNAAKGYVYDVDFSWPCLDEKYVGSGVASGHYFHQDLLVARRIFLADPFKHVDVGSRVDGFVAHVATFRTIEVLDIRPLAVRIPNIIFRRFDLMAPDFPLKDYCDSASCLNALEHFGLGRYGDPMNLVGHELGFRNLYKMLQHSGILYLSVPIGSERVEFNAHRVFEMETILGMIKNRFRTLNFSYVDDAGLLHENVRLNSSKIKSNYGCTYGCGIFELEKIG